MTSIASTPHTYTPNLEEPPPSSSIPIVSAISTTTTTFPEPQESPSVIKNHDVQKIGDEPPVRKKQKRNKPTLSCMECVSRKTKCDRSRPGCIACLKRQTICRYAHIANVIEEAEQNGNSISRESGKPSKSKPIIIPPQSLSAQYMTTPYNRSNSRASNGSSTGLLSNVPYSRPSASNVFGIGSEHPFANYWTCTGGLPEVVSILPSRQEADALLDIYFESVDPVYPMIHRQTFYAEYSQFMAMSITERNTADSLFLSLLFAMLAIGTQFTPIPPQPTPTPTTSNKVKAEFLVSAAHQSLRLSGYLNKATIKSIQAMVLITYFLINDNHASDGWAFAGILMRQAYALGLHRDPKRLYPNATLHELQQRRKLWQAVLLQDTFLTVLLSLPPSATHTDVSVDDLSDEESSIASTLPTDTAYIRGSWLLANLVQETICSPRALSLPICKTAQQRSHLLSRFETVYQSVPDIFRSWDTSSLFTLARESTRVVRQILFLTSNYYHNIMLIHSSPAEDSNLSVSVDGALDAAHTAIGSFFLLWRIFPGEAKVWWHFNHRAFLEAMCMGGILEEFSSSTTSSSFSTSSTSPSSNLNNKPLAAAAGNKIDNARNPRFERARTDIVNMIGIMQAMAAGNDDSAEVARTRINVLSKYLEV